MNYELIETICPNCNTIIKTHSDYPVWCKNCEWNLKYDNNLLPKTRLEELYKKISKKSGNITFEKIKNDNFDSKLTKLTFLRAMIYLFSAIIISMSFVILFLSMYLIIFSQPYYQKFIGLLLLGIFYFIRPKNIKLPSDKFVSKNDFPNLYNLINLVCTKLNTSDVEGIIINDEFNASITEIGFKKKKVLYIGLPLWSVLTDDEKLGLIGHEISHCTNGDPVRSGIISKALNTLNQTAIVIYPERLQGDLSHHHYGGLESVALSLSKILIIPLNILLRGVSHFIWFLMKIMYQMVWLDSQRAEYLADISGSSISGHKASIDLMRKLGYIEMLSFEIEKTVRKGKKESDALNIFDVFKNKISNLPEHEKERISRIQMKEEHRLDLTHPPTYSRINLLNEKGYKGIKFPDLKLNINFGKIENEFKTYEKKIHDKLMDSYRNKMYK